MAEQDATVEILKDIRDEIRSARNELRDEIRGVRTERIEPDPGRKGRVLLAVAVGAAVLVVGLFAVRDRGNGGNGGSAGNVVTKGVAQQVAAETLARLAAAPIALPDPPMPVRAVSPESPVVPAAKPAPMVALHPAAVAAPKRARARATATAATRHRASAPTADLEPAKL